MYQIQGTITITDNGWTKTVQVPTFYLNIQVQGIISAEHAIQIAKTIVDPLNQLSVDLVARML